MQVVKPTGTGVNANNGGIIFICNGKDSLLSTDADNYASGTVFIDGVIESETVGFSSNIECASIEAVEANATAAAMTISSGKATLKYKKQLMNKRGYTLIEGLISMLIISVVGMTALGFVSGYQKMTFVRDRQNAAVISNMTYIEKLKAEVHTLPQLYDFSRDKNMKIIAVGVGEISFISPTTYSVLTDERYGFSEKLTTATPKLFRIELGGDIPNTRLITVLRLE